MAFKAIEASKEKQRKDVQSPNFNKVTAIFGERGTGKTEYVKGNDELKLPGFIRTYLAKNMKILFIDTIDHPSYSDIEILPVEKLSTWKKGVYRIFVDEDDMPQLIKYINSLPSIWNSCLIFEDAYKHMEDRVPKPISKLCIDSKQKNIDVIFLYHGFSFAPPKLFGLLDLIEVFKVLDHPECRKAKMRSYYPTALATYNKVMAHPSPYYHALIDTKNNR